MPALPTVAILKQKGALAVQYLLKAIRPDGSFVYEADAATGLQSADYNILRHAGTLYTLYQWAAMFTGEIPITSARKATDFLSTHIRPLDADIGLYYITEEQEVKLGGSALALLALAEKQKTDPDAEEKNKMQQLAAFITWMQQQDGRFQSKFNENDAVTKFSRFHSSYYPGQAILALAKLYKSDPNPHWLSTAERGARYLLKTPLRSKTKERLHNHWLVMSLVELYGIKANPAYLAEIRLINKYVQAQAISEINAMQSDPSAKLSGSASMATYGESLSAQLLLEKSLGNDTVTQDLEISLSAIIGYCLGLQVNGAHTSAEQYAGGITRTATDTTIRIDYVQHTLQVIMNLMQVHLHYS